MPTSMTMDNQTYYLHYDQVGSLRAVSNQEHKILKEVTYNTFGNILHDTNRSLNIPFGFAGGLHDTDTNLVHFGYREYDPHTGKWTVKDPIDFSGGDSNLYGYVLQDPVNLVDPEGLISMTQVVAIVSSFGTVHTIWTWHENFKENNAKKDIRDAQCAKLTDPLARALCYNKSNLDRDKDARKNSCEVGSGLTDDIAGFRY